MAGCGNHGCFIEKPKGQGTNGRCKCLRELGKENELALKHRLNRAERLQSDLRKIVEDMEDEPGCSEEFWAWTIRKLLDGGE